MSIQHARDPSKMSNSDYGEFCREVKEFLADDRSLPHRPTQWVAEQATLCDNYNVKLDTFRTLNADAKGFSEEVSEKMSALEEKIRWFRSMIPVVDPDSDIHYKKFGFDKPVPDSYAEIKDYCDVANTYWKTVYADPLFAAIRSDVDGLAPLIVAFDTVREAQFTAVGEMHQAQNEMDTAREEHNKLERQIFNWYRTYYKDGQDDYWEQTPWGKAPEKVDDKFPAPGMLMYDQFRNDFSWEQVSGATGYELEIINKTTQETTTIETPNNQKRQELAKGDYAVKVRAVKVASDPVYSQWSGDVMFTVKPAPANFKYNPGKKELSWDSVDGANIYEVRKDGSFDPIYLGADTEFVLDLPAGQYQFRVRGGEDGANWWGQWSDVLVVNV